MADINQNKRKLYSIIGEHLGQISEISQLGFCIFDREYFILSSNGVFSKIVGGPAEGRKITEVIASVALDLPAEDVFAPNPESGSCFDAVIRMKDNSQRTVSVFLHPVIAGKEYVFTFAVFVDITEKAQKAAMLHSSEAHFRDIINNITEYIFSVEYDESGSPVFSYHSPSCFDVTGYTVEDFDENKSLWYDMIYPDDRERVMSHLEEIRRTLRGSAIEHRIRHKSGMVKWVSNSSSLRKNAEGRVTRIDGFILDITERKMMEEGMKKLYVAVEQSPVSIIITDVAGNIEYVNPKFEMLTGYKWNEVFGKNPRLLKSGETPKSVYEDLWRCVTSGKEWVGEFINKKKSGEMYYEQAYISPIMDRSGKIVNYLAIKEDVSSMKKAQMELKEKENEILQKNEIMEQDMLYAKKVQQALLPQSGPDIEYLSIGFRFKPLALVGGDFLSFACKSDYSGVFIADAVGHGISAALFMSLLKFATDSLFDSHGNNTADFLMNLNKSLYSSINNYFVTAAYAVFTPSESGVNILFSSGGHPPLILFRKSVNSFEMIQARGTILGMFENGKYGTGSAFLEKGDRLYLYTDGIPETTNEKGEIIGYENTVKILKSTYDPDIEKTIENLFSELDIFRGDSPLDDDILFVVVEIK